MIQNTSVDAYYAALQTLGDRQIEVYTKLKEMGSATNNELSHALGLPINEVTPRTYELREKKIVEECTRRPCSITGKNVIAWRVINY